MVSLSTNRWLLPGWIAQHVAATAGIGGIDIDATSAIGAWLAGRTGSPGPAYVPALSLWVPITAMQSPRTRRLITAVQNEQSGRPPLLIAALPASATPRTLARDVEAVRVACEGGPLALGLPSAALRGGRPHLVQLGGLRRFAEEWDVSVAIDLSGKFDPTWEAEAAVARLGDRLGLLRIRASASSRSAIGQDRVACRALHAAIDRGHGVQIAVCPTQSVPFLTTPRAAAQGARRAADYIADRAAHHAEALREGIDHFEGSPSSRGN